MSLSDFTRQLTDTAFLPDVGTYCVDQSVQGYANIQTGSGSH